MHKSVGAIIKKDGKILMLDRANFPLGWSWPAGHVEEGEKPEEALRREVKEEMGLEIKNFKLLEEEFVMWNECKKAVKGHHWYVFEVTEWEGNLKFNGEAKGVGWFSPEEARGMLLEEVVVYWFKKLKII